MAKEKNKDNKQNKNVPVAPDKTGENSYPEYERKATNSTKEKHK